MRFSQVLVAIAASFLVTSEVLLAAPTSEQATIAKVVMPGIPSQRFLRSQSKQSTVSENDDSSDEERGELSFSQMKAILKDMGIWKEVKPKLNQLQNHPRYSEYEEIANKILKTQKKKKPPMVITRESY
ncbi:unnamed protein product [Phytophthora fragariaefolia]|uniref:RxLR effector protein n=1 Tax=Phytophthora fragariaefolia TaxID=1490495 RepID=A0A9W6XV51_9STRA|nr:unnamed protein product [Phytophthora fragariaefolia]